MRELYATATKCLDQEVRKWTPPPIYDNSNAMNYVLTKWKSRLLNEPSFVTPYLEARFGELGETLDSYLGEEDKGHVDDISVADEWASELGIAGWYRWTKFH